MNNGIRSAGETCCPLCGKTTDVSLRWKKNGCDIYSCRECALLFVYPQPSDDELARIYSADYFKRRNKYRRGCDGGVVDPNVRNDQTKFALVQRYKTKGWLLDVGCALGGFLHCAYQGGFEVEGVELSIAAASHAKEEYGLRVHVGDLTAASLPGKSFDVITLWDVIEHVTDPQAIMREVSRLLSDGGVVFVSTGDSSSWCAKLMGRFWYLLTPPQHLFFFTPKSFARVLQPYSLRVFRRVYSGKYTSIEFLLFKLQETCGFFARPLVRLAQMLAVNDTQLCVNMGDIMTCVVTKEGQERR